MEERIVNELTEIEKKILNDILQCGKKDKNFNFDNSISDTIHYEIKEASKRLGIEEDKLKEEILKLCNTLSNADARTEINNLESELNIRHKFLLSLGTIAFFVDGEEEPSKILYFLAIINGNKVFNNILDL